MTATRILASLVLVLGFAATANAGTVDYQWGTCIGLAGASTDRSPGGFPGNEVQAISLSNHVVPDGEAIFGHGSVIAIGGSKPFPDLWRYDAVGCMTNNFLTIDVFLLGIAGCTGLAFGQGTVVPIEDYNYDAVSEKVTYTLEHAYPQQGGNAAPPALALMYKLTYPAGSGFNCDGALAPLCFHLTRASITEGPTSTTAASKPQPINNGYVTWEDANNETRCPGATPSETSTWGRVKGLYR